MPSIHFLNALARRVRVNPLLRTAARVVLPKEQEYRFGITPRPLNYTPLSREVDEIEKMVKTPYTPEKSYTPYMPPTPAPRKTITPPATQMTPISSPTMPTAKPITGIAPLSFERAKTTPLTTEKGTIGVAKEAAGMAKEAGEWTWEHKGEIADVANRAIANSALQVLKSVMTGVRALSEAKPKPIVIDGQKIDLSLSDTKLFKSIDKYIKKPINEFSKKAIKGFDELQLEIARPLFDKNPNLSNWKEYAYTAISGGLSLAEALGIFAVSKSPDAAAAFLSYVESSDEYNQARAMGADPDRALKTALASGLGTFISEKIGMEWLLKSLGGDIIQRLIVMPIRETAQELVQTWWQNLVRKIGYDKAQKVLDDTWETIVGIAPSTFLLGLGSGTYAGIRRNQLINKVSKQGGLTKQEATQVVDYLAKKATEIENAMTPVMTKRPSVPAGLSIREVGEGAGEGTEPTAKPSRGKPKIRPVKGSEDVRLDRIMAVWDKVASPELKKQQWEAHGSAIWTKGEYISDNLFTAKKVTPDGVFTYDDINGLRKTGGKEEWQRLIGTAKKTLRGENTFMTREQAESFLRMNGYRSKLKPETKIPKELERSLNEAIERARRLGYSFDEFYMYVSGGATQGKEYNNTLRKYNSFPGSERLSNLGVNPNRVVTIYRGIDPSAGKVRKSINDGDFVTTDYQQALEFAGMEPQYVVKKKVLAKDLIVRDKENFDPKRPFGPYDEFIYSKHTNPTIRLSREWLKDFYNQAIKETKPKIAKPAPKSKTTKEPQKISKKAKTKPAPKPAKKKAARTASEIRKEILAKIREKSATVEAIKKDIVNYAKEKLDLKERGKLLAMVKNAKTFTDLDKAKSYIEALQYKAELRAEAAKVVSDLKKLDLKHLRPERQRNIKKIIEKLDMASLSKAKRRVLESRLRHIHEHPDSQIPPDKLAELKRLEKKPIRELTPEELRLIRDAIRHEVKLNELKNKLIFGKRYREAKTVIDEAINNVLKKTKQAEDADLIDSSAFEKRIGRLRQEFTVESYNPETVAQILDRAQDGVIKKVFYDGIDEGTTEQFKYIYDAQEFLSPIKKMRINDWSYYFQKDKSKVNLQTIKLPSGKTIKMTKGERISFLLHYLNEKNMRHILKGGIRFETNLARKHRLSREDVEAIVNSATEAEKKVAKLGWKFFNVFQKERINKISLDLNGFEIATEKNYYPIRTVELDRKRDALKMQKTFTQATLEGMGIFKERTNAANALVIEDFFKTLYTHIKKTSAYYGLAKPLRNAKMLLYDGKFRETVRRVYGKHYVDYLDDYLRAIEDNSHDTNNLERLTAELINKLDIAILGANPFVMLKQPISYCLALTEMDSKYIAKAAVSKVNYEEIKKHSPQLRFRLDGHVTREVGEVANIGAVRKFFTGKDAIGTKFMAGIRRFDALAIGRIWNAAKLEIRDKHPNLTGEQYWEAVRKRAEEVIRRTQPTFHLKDRSAVGRRHGFWRWITKYTSQRNKNYNIIRRAILEYNLSNHTAGDKARLLKKLFIVTVVNAWLIEMVNYLRRKIYGKKPLKPLQQVTSMFGTILGNFYYVGDLFSSYISKVERGAYGWDWENIMTSFVDQVIDTLAMGTQAIEQAVKQEKYKSGTNKGKMKWKKTAIRAIDYALSVVGKLKGIPYETLSKLTRFRKWAEEAAGYEGGETEKKKPTIKIPTIDEMMKGGTIKVKGIEIPTVDELMRGKTIGGKALGEGTLKIPTVDELMRGETGFDISAFDKFVK